MRVTVYVLNIAEADRWLDLGRSCAIQQRAPCQSGAGLEGLWDVTPETGNQHWAEEPGNATAITSLIRDLSLGNGSMTSSLSHPTPTTNLQRVSLKERETESNKGSTLHHRHL